MAKVNSTSTKKSGRKAPAKISKASLDRFLTKLDDEPPQVTADMAEQVDARLTNDWKRRAAICFLERPFKEWTETFAKDRRAAVAFAALAEQLPESIDRYKALAELLTSAQTRIRIALCSREDMWAVIEEARSNGE